MNGRFLGQRHRLMFKLLKPEATSVSQHTFLKRVELPAGVRETTERSTANPRVLGKGAPLVPW